MLLSLKMNLDKRSPWLGCVQGIESYQGSFSPSGKIKNMLIDKLILSTFFNPLIIKSCQKVNFSDDKV